jgi:hypothetical protein
MPNTPPITGPHELNAQGDMNHIQSQATVFMAERVAGIEWQLAQLNEKLFQIVARLSSPTNP